LILTELLQTDFVLQVLTRLQVPLSFVHVA